MLHCYWVSKCRMSKKRTSCICPPKSFSVVFVFCSDISGSEFFIEITGVEAGNVPKMKSFQICEIPAPLIVLSETIEDPFFRPAPGLSMKKTGFN